MLSAPPKPLIGITLECDPDPEDPRSRGKLSLNWNYAEQVALAGGVPLLIPPTADMDVVAKLIDGWLIPGGDDIDARYFGEENHPKVTAADPSRFEAESRLYGAVSDSLPIFGICYGCQFLNVVRGGSLIQHLPDVLGHEGHTSGRLERYELGVGARLEEVAGTTTMEGKSYHHQAVGRVGSGLEVVAKSEDGTIEALEATDRPWLIGVQWHPERTPEDEATQRLFRGFIAAARTYAQRRVGASL